MAVKFKVGFTMSAETLFGIIAKFLPVEDLQVEEFDPRPPKLKPAKIARLAAPPKQQIKQIGRNRHSGPALEGGVNGVILNALEDGHTHRYKDIKAAVAAAGYAGTGIGSKLARLKELNAVHQVSIGHWRIGEPVKKSA